MRSTLIVEFNRDNGARRHNVITMAKDGREFLLMPMVHVAHRSFYVHVRRYLADRELIVSEGLQGPWGVREIMMFAPAILTARTRRWLQTQPGVHAKGRRSLFPPEAVLVVADTTKQQCLQDMCAAFGFRLRLMRFLLTPYTLMLGIVRGPHKLNRTIRDIHADEVVNEALPQFLREIEQRRKAAFHHRRNALLCDEIARLDKTGPSKMAVVYGARHMPVVYGYLTGLGYEVTGTRWIESMKNEFPAVSGLA